VTKLAPKRLVGQMMGTWFVAASLGNLLAGKIAGDFSEGELQHWPALCLPMMLAPVALGVLLIVCAKPIKKLMSGVT
jgi:proton-dependent oligopeptide transporter, POT family